MRTLSPIFTRLLSAATIMLLVASPKLPACMPQETADHSQRRLPFPERQPTIPDVHLELLRRLRDALQQEKPAPKPSSPSAIPQPQPQDTDSPAPPIDSDDLSKLGQSLSDLINRIPPEIVPKELPNVPTPQLQQSLQHPETQQSLKKLLEQFRKDGVLPPSLPDGSPAPTPPSLENQSPKTSETSPNERGNPQPESAPLPNPPLSRNSLKQLENFLQELQQNSEPPSQTLDNQAPQSPTPISPPNNPPQTIPRNPLRRRDRNTTNPPSQTPPSKPEVRNSSPPANEAPQSTPSPDIMPSPNLPQSPPKQQTSNEQKRSFLESLEQLFQQPSANSEKTANNSDTLPSTETAPPQTQPPFSIPEFLRRQLQDPALRQTDTPRARQPANNLPPSNNSDRPQQEIPPTPDPPSQPTPSPPTTDEGLPQNSTQPRQNRTNIDLPPNQSFGESFRQLLNEARREARESSESNSLQMPAPDSPPAGPQQTPATPPPRPPDNTPRQAESLLRLLNDLSKDADRRDKPRTEVPDRTTRQQQIAPSTLDWLLNNPPPEPNNEPNAQDTQRSTPNTASADSTSNSVSELNLPTTAIAIAGLLALGLAVAGILLKLANHRRLDEHQSSTGLAPMTPEQIRGRRDVVAAFHQLARRGARSFRPWWHHQQIEALLIQTMPGRKSAIARLAGVYEQSRYSPESVALSDREIQQARDALRECQSDIR